MNVLKFRKRKRGVVTTITAEELATLLRYSPVDFIPYLALRAFAGLRDNEARLLDWKHIDLSENWIDIQEHIAKQANKDEGVARMVRIRPTLAAWLRPQVKSSGPVCPYKSSVKALAELKSIAGLIVPRNALRHSFISSGSCSPNQGGRDRRQGRGDHGVRRLRLHRGYVERI